VQREQRSQVYIGDAVRVGQAERALAQPVGCERHAPAGLRLLPGVEALDLDAVGPPLLHDEPLDHLAEVARQQQEAAEALGGVDPDYVPDDRLAADLHQRFGDRVSLLLQARAAPAAEDRDRDLGP